jgi:hypothetical protein
VIVFESGRGTDMHGWKAVARPLAAGAQVVLYDRFCQLSRQLGARQQLCFDKLIY